MEVQPTLSRDRMGNSPSLPGLGGGRTHVKRDMAKDDQIQKAELRPENLSVSSSESELSEEEKDEQFDGEFREKLTRGTNRKSRNEVAQRSSFSHNCYPVPVVVALHTDVTASFLYWCYLAAK